MLAKKHALVNITDYRRPERKAPKINFHSPIFRYGRSIFCLPDRPKFSDFFDLCLHWVSVVLGQYILDMMN